MTGRLAGWIGCGVLIASGLWSSAAFGQGFGLGFYNYGNGYGINQMQPPYYAMFPPVYYSYPVARPYGFSPFAYPPGVMTPDIKPNLGAAEFRNPFVPSSSGPAPSGDQTVSAGRMYINPFVSTASGAGKASLARRNP